MRLSSVLLLGVLLLAQAASSEDVNLKVVVSADNAVASLNRRDVARIFLRRTTSWPDGSSITPVDQSSRSPARTAFTNAILASEGLGKMSAVEDYWLQQIYSGRGTPPRIVDGDAAVVAFVAANPGAIGYVSGPVDLSAVKTVVIGH